MVNLKRYYSIDILRTIAIIGMIQVHIVEWLSGYYDSDTMLYQLSMLVGSFPAAMFTFLVGTSLYISVKRQEDKGIDPRLIADRNLRRGMSIFLIGLIFMIFVWMPEEVFAWDILTFIAASLLILFPLRKLRTKGILLVLFLMLAVSPVIRFFTDFHSHWNQWGEYVPSFELPGVLMGFFANAYFPVFPWLIFPMGGYIVGRACYKGKELHLPRTLLPAGITLVAMSAAMMILSSLATLPEIVTWYISPFSFYPASTSFVLLAMGINILFFVFFTRIFDMKERKNKDSFFLVFCNRYSRYALTAYVAHHALFLWSLIAYSYYLGELHRWTYYGYIMPTAHALVVTLAFVILFYLAIAAWDKRGGRYSLEWWLQRLTG